MSLQITTGLRTKSLEPSDSDVFSVEDVLTEKSALFNPVLLFKNTNPVEFGIVIERILNLGNSADPLLTGVFTEEVVNTTLAANGSFVWDFGGLHLTDTYITHQVTITNNDLVATAHFYAVLQGGYWESLSTPYNRNFVSL